MISFDSAEPLSFGKCLNVLVCLCRPGEGLQAVGAFWRRQVPGNQGGGGQCSHGLSVRCGVLRLQQFGN